MHLWITPRLQQTMANHHDNNCAHRSAGLKPEPPSLQPDCSQRPSPTSTNAATTTSLNQAPESKRQAGVSASEQQRPPSCQPGAGSVPALLEPTPERNHANPPPEGDGDGSARAPGPAPPPGRATKRRDLDSDPKREPPAKRTRRPDRGGPSPSPPLRTAPDERAHDGNRNGASSDALRRPKEMLAVHRVDAHEQTNAQGGDARGRPYRWQHQRRRQHSWPPHSWPPDQHQRRPDFQPPQHLARTSPHLPHHPRHHDADRRAQPPPYYPRMPGFPRSVMSRLMTPCAVPVCLLDFDSSAPRYCVSDRSTSAPTPLRLHTLLLFAATLADNTTSVPQGPALCHPEGILSTHPTGDTPRRQGKTPQTRPSASIPGRRSSRLLLRPTNSMAVVLSRPQTVWCHHTWSRMQGGRAGAQSRHRRLRCSS